MSIETKEVTLLENYKAEATTTPGHPTKSLYKNRNEDGYVMSEIEFKGERIALTMVVDESGGIKEDTKISGRATAYISRELPTRLSRLSQLPSLNEALESTLRQLSQELEADPKMGSVTLAGLVVNEKGEVIPFNVGDVIIYEANSRGGMKVMDDYIIDHTPGQQSNIISQAVGSDLQAVHVYPNRKLAGMKFIIASDGSSANFPPYDLNNNLTSEYLVKDLIGITDLRNVPTEYQVKDILKKYGIPESTDNVNAVYQILSATNIPQTAKVCYLAGIFGSMDNITCMEVG